MCITRVLALASFAAAMQSGVTPDTSDEVGEDGLVDYDGNSALHLALLNRQDAAAMRILTSIYRLAVDADPGLDREGRSIRGGLMDFCMSLNKVRRRAVRAMSSAATRI